MKVQKFGLELRKVGDVGNIYEDVNKVLFSQKVAPGTINADIQKNAVAHSLQKMLTAQKHFSVCTIRDCAKLCQLVIPEDRMNVYETQHCVHWAAMTPEFRQTLICLVLDDFRSILDPKEIEEHVSQISTK